MNAANGALRVKATEFKRQKQKQNKKITAQTHEKILTT